VFSEARGINTAGTVVGFSSSGVTGGNSTGDKAVSWTGIVPTNLNAISGGIASVAGPALTGSRAEAISPTGEVVGHAYSGTFLALGVADGIRGFYRSVGGTVTRLDPSTNANYPADASLSYGINSSSQVFGQSDPGGAGAGFRASRWSGPTGSSSTPFTYPTVGASSATDYLGFKGNDANRIVGTAETINGSGVTTAAQAFGADPVNGTTLLNNLGGGAFGIANAISNAAINIIVGGSGTGFFGSGTERATAWTWNSGSTTPSPTPVDLNTRLVANPTGLTLIEGLDVNDAGQIVGFATLPSGAIHAFLLTPVPEPGTLALCGVALGGVGLRAWRRRKSTV
jgi:probable HAF family extracellular repeat protein